MAEDPTATDCLRIAAAADVHCSETNCGEIAASVREVAEKADLILFCGDLTTHGEPEQAALLADAVSEVQVPVFAVLGNHDWHADKHEELVSALTTGGIRVLDRSWSVCEAAGVQVGIVGAKGFVGGFAGSHLPDFGEPLLRQVYRECSEEVGALDAGLREVGLCQVRVVMLHYAPTETTIAGEPPGIWAFLGSDRLAAPIVEHEPDLVLHGHAHAGTFRGSIGEVPVYNVSVPVMGQDFWLFELDVSGRARTPIH
ncbi:MAG: metallophosphoesterase [Solirubrobacterales bacterium]|nr:metallophosphoesterase [Solirubrobacterales bacterium]